MKEYTTREFNSAVCRILSEAEVETVIIRRRGRPSLRLQRYDDVATNNVATMAEVATSEVTTDKEAFFKHPPEIQKVMDKSKELGERMAKERAKTTVKVLEIGERCRHGLTWCKECHE